MVNDLQTLRDVRDLLALLRARGPGSLAEAMHVIDLMIMEATAAPAPQTGNPVLLSDQGVTADSVATPQATIKESLQVAAPQAGGQDAKMVSLGGTAPLVPRWLLDAAQRIAQYMDAHSPGDWAIGGIQKRQASGQAPAASPELTWALIRDHLGSEIADLLCVTRWKDGIDIQEPVAGLKKLIAACAPVAASAEPVAVLRFDRDIPGRENEMPTVVSCNRLPDGEYAVYLAPVAAQQDATPVDDKSHPRFIAGYDAGTKDARLSAASVQPRPDDWTYFDDWLLKEAPLSHEVTHAAMARHAWRAGVRFADLFPLAAPVSAMPEGWTLIEEKTCYVLMHDGAVIATLAGSDSEENAAIIARAIHAHASAASEEPTDTREVAEAINYIDDFIARCNGDDRRSCDAVNVLRKALAVSVAAQAQSWAPAGPLRIECDPERFGKAPWHVTDGHHHAVGATPNEALNGFARYLAAQAPAANGDALDAAFEAVRKQLCKIPRYSFLISVHGNLLRMADRSGKWIEFDAAHALIDPVAVDAAMQRTTGSDHD